VQHISTKKVAEPTMMLWFSYFIFIIFSFQVFKFLDFRFLSLFFIFLYILILLFPIIFNFIYIPNFVFYYIHHPNIIFFLFIHSFKKNTKIEYQKRTRRLQGKKKLKTPFCYTHDRHSYIHQTSAYAQRKHFNF
jgi:hypothetical protein